MAFVFVVVVFLPLGTALLRSMGVGMSTGPWGSIMGWDGKGGVMVQLGARGQQAVVNFWRGGGTWMSVMHG